MKPNYYKTRSLTVFKIPIYSYWIGSTSGWFRMFGVGLAWKNMKYYSLSFSERYGYSNNIKVGNLLIKII